MADIQAEDLKAISSGTDQNIGVRPLEEETIEAIKEAQAEEKEKEEQEEEGEGEK